MATRTEVRPSRRVSRLAFGTLALAVVAFAALMTLFQARAYQRRTPAERPEHLQRLERRQVSLMLMPIPLAVVVGVGLLIARFG